MNIKGKVVQVLPVESGTSKNGNQWSKASLIVETTENPQYPKKIKISNMKNAEAFSKLAVGSEVTFKVEIESREYNGRWYTEINCWGWDAAAQTEQALAQPAQQSEYLRTMRQPIPSQQTETAQDQTDDLLF